METMTWILIGWMAGGVVVFLLDRLSGKVRSRRKT